ncbi:hypothetical protein GCM10025876_33030 [Demequina litorisediminis]|uniref:Thymidylate synthase/dCMP hydroxymethylase domain-containing protein n=1 Tax=Demequina litorisediminis TaxID=1849022 RepID=A0ABQ6IHB1_9MICO|nr:hypothetical protein GCM10025876_33030 [Demequina litorisediminis]
MDRRRLPHLRQPPRAGRACTSREPYPYPTLRLPAKDSLFDYDIDDVVIEGYQHHPGIKAPVAV